jgi:hypothetical protein
MQQLHSNTSCILLTLSFSFTANKGLDHTDWNDCEFPGDGVDDTYVLLKTVSNAFFATLLWYSCFSQLSLCHTHVVSCAYRPYHLKPPKTNVSCDAVLDTCPDKPGLDLLENFMSYGKECGKSFTKGQHNRMRAVYETFRLNLDETDLCFFEVDIQFDDKPEQVTVFVESNDWYDFLIVNGTKYKPNGSYTIESFFVEGEGVSGDTKGLFAGLVLFSPLVNSQCVSSVYSIFILSRA